MAILGRSVKAAEVDDQNDFENLPEGIYALEIIQSEIKDTDTEKGQGKMLALRYSVIEPEEYNGRLIFGNIMLEHTNPKTQEIGQGQLEHLIAATGIEGDVDDSEMLHFHGFAAKVGLSKERKVGNTIYAPRNEVKKFYHADDPNMPEIGVTAPAAANDNRKPANDNTPPRGDARTTGNGGAAATAGKSRPWGRKAA
ncbi:MAG: DUF669 domain-containing protein [Xanthobacteraceae bacterium]